jgi:type VI secretion system protein VasI
MARSAGLIAGMVWLLTTPAMATDPLDREIARCAQFGGNLERLQCFDDLAQSLHLAGPQPQPVNREGVGEWQVDRLKNPIDDTEKVRLVLESNEGRSRFGKPIHLEIRCVSGQPDLVIHWHDYLGLERPKVITRIGTERAVTAAWLSANTNDGTFLPKPMLMPFLRQMVRAETMVAQTVPYSSPTITASFNITGLSEAIRPLAEVCKLSL